MGILIVPAREVIRATPRTRIITADLRGQPFPFRAGQAVFAGLADSPVRRPYSIACSPRQAAESGALELLVQIDDHTAPDPHLDRVEPGTNLRIEGPFGAFTLPATFPERDLLLVAGGTGIAPLRSILWDTLEHDDGTRRFSVVYSARTPEEFAYAGELQALAAAGRIALILTVTRDTDAPWPGSRGRINRDLIASVVRTPQTRCLICGPPALVADATLLLQALGVTESRILRERDS